MRLSGNLPLERHSRPTHNALYITIQQKGMGFVICQGLQVTFFPDPKGLYNGVSFQIINTQRIFIAMELNGVYAAKIADPLYCLYRFIYKNPNR